MKQIIIKNCDDCQYVSHSGGDIPEGAEDICGHSDTYIVRNSNFDKRHWRQRILKTRNGKLVIPSWCPL